MSTLRTLNVTVADTDAKRPLRITPEGKFCVKIKGLYQVVEPVNATTVRLTDDFALESRAARFRDLGLKTKAERDAEAAKEQPKQAPRADSVPGQRNATLERLMTAFPELTPAQLEAIALLVAAR